MTNPFFNEQAEQSLVKTQIVVKYFAAWATVMKRQADKIGYLDFYAGPGRYASGEKSTPLLVLEHAISNPGLADKLVTVFNDIDPDATSSLESEIAQLPGLSGLRFQPTVRTGPVDDELAAELESMRMIPSLSFIDPWGYKGLSLRLVQAALKDWGSEVIFFFNYNRINMGVPNPIVDVHMEALFGEERLQRLQDELAAMSPLERETRITRALGEAINPNGDRYLIPFRFVRDGKRTSHYICFVTKHPLGYSIMKDVMAKHGILDQDEVPRFEYYPRWAGRQMHFDEHRPLLSLPAELSSRFKGQTITVRRLIDQHQLGTPFISRNYKSVIREMERQGTAVCDPPMDRRRKNTLRDDTLVTFPA